MILLVRWGCGEVVNRWRMHVDAGVNGQLWEDRGLEVNSQLPFQYGSGMIMITSPMKGGTPPIMVKRPGLRPTWEIVDASLSPPLSPPFPYF